jgi:diguanylate cyclase (GGDEF)-like protein/PAS domain S-box-containing protein
VHRDGTIFPVQLASNPVLDTDGTPLGIVTCCEEITERKRAEQALRSSEERYRLLFERNLAGVYRATLEGRILECNQAFAEILGYERPAEVLAKSAWDLFVSREDRETALAQLREQGTLTNREQRLRRKDGGVAWVLENETLLRRADGEGDVVTGTVVDVTERKQAAARVEFQAYHDSLTGLPNRVALRERMHVALAQARRSGLGMALMFVDLDEFKPVNDRYGHGVGDRLLKEVAVRLRECVRGEDTVARVGGDEFVLLLSSVRLGETAARVAQKLLERVREPVRIDENELRVSASVGIALYPDDGTDLEGLLRSADAAMYRAKQLGNDGFQFCDPAAGPLFAGRLALRERLRQAFELGQLSLAYQPEYDARSRRLLGMEALLRWHDPKHGTLKGAEFVSAAEETGLIVRLGDWAMRRACTRARAAGMSGSLRLAVNVSVRQLRQENFSGRVQEILAETGFEARRLELEVSEAAALQHLEQAGPVLRELSELGVGISLDDFGASFSSLSQLKLLPAKRLKIDRSLISNVSTAPRDRAVVQGIVSLAHSLGLAAVAKGVETEQQRATVEQLGCDALQGALFGEPVPEEQLETLLAAG